MTARLEEDASFTIQKLIDTCRKSQDRFKKAAEAAENRELKVLLNLYSQQRTRFAEELSKEWTGSRASLEFTDEDAASASGAGVFNSQSDLLRDCLNKENQALELYREALGRRIPTKAHFLISAQYSLMQRVQQRMQGLLSQGNGQAVVREAVFRQATPA